MIKIEEESLVYNDLLSTFKSKIEQFPIILAILEKRQFGLVFSNESNDEILVISKSGFCFSEVKVENYSSVFQFIISNSEIPNYIHFYSPAESFLEFVKNKTEKYKLRNRVQYQYEGARSEFHGNYSLTEGYQISSIRSIDFQKLDVFNLDLENKFWSSKEDFMENAIGYVIVNANQNPEAICYSACVTSNHAEMDTLVLENNRGKGFMRLVSIPFFEEVNSKGLITHWDTFEENIPSFLMGAKFKPNYTNRYKLLSVFFEND